MLTFDPTFHLVTVDDHKIMLIIRNITNINVTITSSEVRDNSLFWLPLYLGSKLWGLASEFKKLMILLITHRLKK